MCTVAVLGMSSTRPGHRSRAQSRTTSCHSRWGHTLPSGPLKVVTQPPSQKTTAWGHATATATPPSPQRRPPRLSDYRWAPLQDSRDLQASGQKGPLGSRLWEEGVGHRHKRRVGCRKDRRPGAQVRKDAAYPHPGTRRGLDRTAARVLKQLLCLPRRKVSTGGPLGGTFKTNRYKLTRITPFLITPEQARMDHRADPHELHIYGKMTRRLQGSAPDTVRLRPAPPNPCAPRPPSGQPLPSAVGGGGGGAGYCG